MFWQTFRAAGDDEGRKKVVRVCANVFRVDDFVRAGKKEEEDCCQGVQRIHRRFILWSDLSLSVFFGCLPTQ
jgi:hypothetical protein